MSSTGSVTHWFHLLEQGDEGANGPLWEHFYPQLCKFAHRRLLSIRGGAADEEDMALSAMASFLDAAGQGRFPDVANRRDLFRILLQMTARKVIDYRRRETCQRRGGGRVRSEADLCQEAESHSLLDNALANVPTPEFAAAMAEELGRLLQLLKTCQEREIAIAKMEGYTNEELASRMDCSVRTIERKLAIIRKRWQSG